MPRKQSTSAPKDNCETDLQPPEYLSEEALEVWNTLAGPLKSAGMLSTLDAHLFASYCQWTGRVMFYERELDRLGGSLTKKNSNGSQTLRPEFKFAKDAAKMSAKLANELGLTPRSRKSLGIRIDTKQKSDPRAALLNRP